MTMIPSRISSVHAGKVAPLGPERVPSAFIKYALDRPVRVTPLGLAGDEQADPTVHGGLEKAVYGYSNSRYAEWQRDFPRHTVLLVPGGFGENLCIDGLTEADIFVGDVHRIGSADLQVCQPREPCFKLALRFADKMMPKAMVRSGRAGWYYRVLEAGEIAPGAALTLAARPNPDFSFARLVELVSHGQVSRPELERLQGMDGLA